MKNAIDTNKFIYNKDIRRQKRKELNIENKFVVGHVGRFHPQKNHDFIIDIFKELNEKRKNSVLLLVGDGELRQSIENKVKELNLLDKVIFTGVRDDIPELLQSMDVFVFPSLYEGLPVTLIEAQATGLPCIVSDTITHEAIISSNIQSVSLQKSAEEWADKILLIDNGSNRENAAIEIINSGFDVNEIAKMLIDFYLHHM